MLYILTKEYERREENNSYNNASMKNSLAPLIGIYIL